MNYSPKQVAAALGGEVLGREVLAPGPNHSAKDRSLAVRFDPAAPDGFVVHSFAGDDPLQCKDHVRSKLGIRWTPRTIQSPITRMPQRVATASKPADYVYELEDGTPYLRVRRSAEKRFFQQHWTGFDWQNGAPTGSKIPYRLPQLKQAEHDAVFIVEGEKDADALAAMGLVATTNAGGAEKWSEDLNQHFRGRDVYILPDNDEPGERHAAKISESLTAVAREIRIIRLPGLPTKGDVSDWLAAGGTADELAKLIEAAPMIGEAPSKLIVSSAEFLAGFIPPDYLIDGMLQRRFCYSLTAPTGSGKTAILLLMSASVALGRAIGEYQVEKGRVLYLAGENPDDVRMRWLAMADSMQFDPAQIDVHFLPGVFKLSEISGRVRAEIETIGPVVMVVVDTSAAYFEGDLENDNVQMGAHARRMRSLVTLPGEPSVVVACHPVKNAGPENMLPRGGGAYLAEMDGNLTGTKSSSIVTLHWQGKYRGPDFVPIPFMLMPATTGRLRDCKGRLIPTVVAKTLSERERGEAEASSRDDEEALLIALTEHDHASMSGLASALSWLTKDGRSAMIESPFLLLPEVDKISRLSDLTRWRLEKSGRFPKRIRIAGRKVAWRKSEIEAWVADPEGWARRHNTQPRILG
jgi:predicted DNA-binding transcriptional regulator AlpA